MARITVEDCTDKVEGPYELVLVAKERTVQLNAGKKPNIDPENDKNTVIALREIAEKKILVKDLEDSAINKLRKHIDESIDDLEKAKPEGDDFENVYKGEVSRSGIPILPSKRARKIPEKITIDKINKETESEQDSESKDEISLEELKKEEEVKDEENESQTSENT